MPRPVSNPPNPWSSTHVTYLEEPPPAATLQVFEEEARSLISENDSPDLPFRYSVNPYRGCLHACAYCYARPSHQYLGWGAGTDFDRKIVVKTNAAAVLRRELARPSWGGDTLVLSGSVDCYQPLEASYRITRGLLEVCLEHRNPVGIITKGALVRRDVDVLAELARKARAKVVLSVTFADDEMARKIEPYASRPSLRFEAMRALSEAGVSTGISISPVIPGLNDPDIPELLGRAREAGATSAFMQALRLPREVLPVFDERLEAALPGQAEKVRRAIREMRGGKMNESAFGARMTGEGRRWEAIQQLFTIHCRKLGLDESRMAEEEKTTFVRRGQQALPLDLGPRAGSSGGRSGARSGQ
ncbi:PA0069 family radical SAM protein [Chondromyces apiculatus]|uniref:Radical SAM domain protein n=1 Tax=Chondromyces apiculatus DSM 436 TaxID=1192034 RepID=A0A017TGM9_9BACT|nr:PA0069 family radical SAM protein [Chondromyces apiculatus]EYF08448.1 Radical SAM domain protein [Chondromyces apiculatus DSM 436]